MKIIYKYTVHELRSLAYILSEYYQMCLQESSSDLSVIKWKMYVIITWLHDLKIHLIKPYNQEHQTVTLYSHISQTKNGQSYDK